MKIHELADLIGGEVFGDGDVDITGVSPLENAQKNEISFLADEKLIEKAHKSLASCIVTKKPFTIHGKTLIYVKNPSLSFIKLLNHFHPPRERHTGVSDKAEIDASVVIGEGASISPFVVICKGSNIGKNVTIHPFTYIGYDVMIGDDVTIKNSVSVLDDSVVGNRVIVHSGAVIGSDGYAYATENERHYKIPQIGKVIVEDDCEIGANVTIDKASFGVTVVKQGTKIDNLVQVGHNVTIGENSLIIAQVGIAGSCKIGKNVILAGQVGVADHLEIGDGAIVAAQGGVTKDIPAKALYSGYPARDHFLARRIYAASVRLPELLKRVKELEKRIGELTEKSSGGKKDV
jgi:UDP-3-O-[3-hydroxymyristoyl] glucosamine N-acyltransferase